MLEIPLLDETKCTSCGDCVEACPSACLEMHGRVPWLPRPADCTGCSLCAAVCPPAALEMECDPTGRQ
jgi:MinD superfamily P-loop ATPase